MKLIDAYRKVINTKNGYYYFDLYVSNKKKWHEAIMTKSELIIAKNKGIISEKEYYFCCDVLQKVIYDFYAEMEKYGDKLFALLNEKVPLSKIENIQGYKEFDLIDWNIETNGELKIKFRPKGVNVSFWNADPKDIEYPSKEIK